MGLNPTIAEEVPEPFLKLQLYGPCTLKLEYEFTKNITLSDVSSYGPSLYEAIQTPLDFRFEASDVDTYQFSLELVYEVRVIQRLKLTMWSGSQQPSIIYIPADGDIVSIHFEVTVNKEPKYPSIEDITESVIQHLLGQLQIYQSENQRIYRSLQDALVIQNYLVALIVILIIIVGGIVLLNLRRGEEGGA